MIKHILLCFSIGAIIGALLMLLAVKITFGDEVPRSAIYGPKKTIVETAWTDNQIVTAIYYAEGGTKTKYPYGIRSVSCETNQACREICRKTVQNYRRRFTKIRIRKSTNSSYLSYLAEHYCPTNGNLSRAEKRLNGNWLKNVNWYLKHPKKES